MSKTRPAGEQHLGYLGNEREKKRMEQTKNLYRTERLKTTASR